MLLGYDFQQVLTNRDHVLATGSLLPDKVESHYHLYAYLT